MTSDSSPNGSNRGRQAEEPGDIPASGFKDIAKRVVAEIKNDSLPVVAAGCAFYAWVALIPSLIATVMVYGLVTSPSQVTSQVESLTSGMSGETATVIKDLVTNATSSGGLSIGLVASLAGVLWAASGGMDGLFKGINIAYDEDTRSFPVRRGLAILLTLGAIVVAIVMLVLIAVFPAVIGSFGLPQAAVIGLNVARWVLLALLLMASLAVLYRIAPNRDDPKMQWVSWGAALATIGWLLGSVGFALYVRFAGSYQATYGALAGVIILNMWLFLSAFMILLGAEINSEMEAQTRHDTTKGEQKPMGERDAEKADELGSTMSS